MTPSVKRHLADQTAWQALERRLAECPAVKKLSGENWDEASTLVHSLADLEESFVKYANELLPRLLAAGSDQDAIQDVLGDIGDELRHVLYHIQDPKFFRHLTDAPAP